MVLWSAALLATLLGCAASATGSAAEPVGTATTADRHLVSRGALPGGRVSELLSLSDAIAAKVARIRGLPIKAPIAKGIVSRAEIREMLVANLKKDRTLREAAAEGAMLVKLGLMTEGTPYLELILDVLTEQIAGYYDADRKKLFLADWMDADPAALAHEIAHALQDQSFDLKRWEDRAHSSSDFALAYAALIEGDAVGVMLDFELGGVRSFLEIPGVVEAMRGIDDSSTRSGSRRSGRTGARGTPTFDAAPRVLRRSLLFPYTEGFAMVFATRKRGGWSAVDALFAAPPDSTEHVLHPAKLFAGEATTDIPVPHTPAIDATHELAFDDVLGEFQLATIFAEHLPESLARRAAAGWAGDRLGVYTPRGSPPSDPATPADTEALVVLHVLHFDRPTDAVEATEALATIGLGLRESSGVQIWTARSGSHVTWVAGVPEAHAEATLEALLAAP